MDTSLEVRINLQTASNLQQQVERDTAALQKLQAAARAGVTVGAAPTVARAAAPTLAATRNAPGQQFAAEQDRLARLAQQQRGALDGQAAALQRVAAAQNQVVGLQRQGEQAARSQLPAIAALAAAQAVATGAAVSGLGKQLQAQRQAAAGQRAVRAAGEGAVGGVSRGRSFLDRVLTDGPSGSLLPQSKAARAEFQELARRAGKVAASAETALEGPNVLKSTAAAAVPARKEAIVSARVESARDLSAALLDKTRRTFLEAQGASPGSDAGRFQKEFDRSQRAAVLAGGEKAGFNAEAQRRRAGLIEGEDFRHATGQGLLSQNLDASNAARVRRIAAEDRRGLLDHPEFVTRRRQEAAAGLEERRTAAGERARAADVLGQLQGGGAYRRTLAEETRAGGLAGVTAQREQAAGAQAQAAFAGTKEGADALKQTARLRRDEARAMLQVNFAQRAAEVGRFGAGLEKATGYAKGLGDAARTAFLIRAAEVGALVSAASPSAMATLGDSVTELAGRMGKDLIPAVDAVSGAFQWAADHWEKVPSWLRGGSTYGVLGTAGVAGLAWGGARAFETGKWALMGQSGNAGILGAARWLRGGAAVPAAAEQAAAQAAASGLGQAGAAAADSARAWYSVRPSMLGALAGVTALGVAAWATVEALHAAAARQSKQNWEEITHAEENLTRGQLEKSEAFKKLQGLPADQREAAAAELAKEYQRREKRAMQGVEDTKGLGMASQMQNTLDEFKLGWAQRYNPLFSPEAGTSPGDQYKAAQEEWVAASKRLAELKAASNELIGGKRFAEQPHSAEAKQREAEAAALRHTYVGLPQAREFEDPRAFYRELQLTALNTQGSERDRVLQQQLENLGILIKGVEQLHQDLSQLNLAPFKKGR